MGESPSEALAKGFDWGGGQARKEGGRSRQMGRGRRGSLPPCDFWKKWPGTIVFLGKKAKQPLNLPEKYRTINRKRGME